MINLPTKFEVPSFTHYRDMKDVENAQNGVVWVVLGHLRSSAIVMSPNDRAHTTSYSTLIETMRLYLVLFSRYSELFVEIRRLYLTPLVFDATDGDDSVRLSKRFLASENYSPGLSCGGVCVILCVAVLIQYWLVTNGQTDGQTVGHMMTANTAP